MTRKYSYDEAFSRRRPPLNPSTSYHVSFNVLFSPHDDISIRFNSTCPRPYSYTSSIACYPVGAFLKDGQLQRPEHTHLDVASLAKIPDTLIEQVTRLPPDVIPAGVITQRRGVLREVQSKVAFPTWPLPALRRYLPMPWWLLRVPEVQHLPAQGYEPNSLEAVRYWRRQVPRAALDRHRIRE